MPTEELISELSIQGNPDQIIRRNLNGISKSSLAVCEELKNAFLEYHRRLCMLVHVSKVDIDFSERTVTYFQNATLPPRVSLEDILKDSKKELQHYVETSEETPFAPYLNVFNRNRVMYEGKRLTIVRLLELLEEDSYTW